MVELLLRYVPSKASLTVSSEPKEQVIESFGNFFFRPDAIGPAGLTLLHIAASRGGSEDFVDALTNHPGLVGVEAWKTIRDSTGSTPDDYTRLRGDYSYIHVVHKKMKKKSETEHVVLDILNDLTVYSSNQQNDKQKSAKVGSSFQISKTETRPIQIQHSCRICDHQQWIYGTSTRFLAYRPAMLLMLAIAAVCVCVSPCSLKAHRKLCL